MVEEKLISTSYTSTLGCRQRDEEFVVNYRRIKQTYPSWPEALLLSYQKGVLTTSRPRSDFVLLAIEEKETNFG